MKWIWLSLLFLSCLNAATAQSPAVDFRVMWYNVENLFDTEDDPDTDDNEFQPSGNRYWTPKRYHHKLRQIARVINAAGEWSTPAVIGLCEVENDTVIQHLLTRTPLRHQHYRYCITSGSDRRGINVALLYQRDKFALLGHSSIPVLYGKHKEKPTRDILHVWGKVASGDTLDILACHLPSRSGGEKETEGYRKEACLQLRSLCDSLSSVRAEAYLLLMGDFNDTPEDRNILHHLGATPLSEAGDSTRLINLFAHPSGKFNGSHKYQGKWHQLDQIIISPNFLDSTRSIQLLPESIRLFAPPFLLTADKTWRGVRPKRTYHGFTYEGGYSDHLPLITDLVIKQ